MTFRRYLAMILKISARFTLKELRCELSSSFDIISNSLERGVLFLQIAVIELFYKQEVERPFNNLTRNKTRQERVFSS